MGALRARRGDRPSAGPLVLVSVSRGRAREPDRPHADVAAGHHRGRSPALRLRLLPALRDGALHRLRAHGGRGSRPRAFTSATTSTKARAATTRSASTSARSRRPLDDYRNRHAQYKTDAHLQAAHAAFPWIVTWDDHEVDNNYANDISEHDDSPAAFLLRRAAAYQAYYEHMPLRPASHSARPGHAALSRVHVRTLAAFLRARHAAVPHRPALRRRQQGALRGHLRPARHASWATRRNAGSSTASARRRTEWNVLAQQVMMARVDQFPGEEKRYSMDQWPGYEMERRRVLEFLHTRRPSQSRRAHRRHSQQLGQRPHDRLERPEVADRRHRVRRHVDHVRRRRRGPDRSHQGGARRESVRQVPERTARLRLAAR